MRSNLNKPCRWCRQALPTQRFDRPLSQVEVTVYRSAFVVVLIIELSKYVKYLLASW
jgi:hypothetical protein